MTDRRFGNDADVSKAPALDTIENVTVTNNL